MNDKDALLLSSFYPENVKINQVIENTSSVTILLKSITHNHVCPKCGQTTNSYHSTYRRRIQDLPILGKSVYLSVTAYRYHCENTSCDQKVFAEELSGFTGKYRRTTSRLEDFIITLALNTSCEGTARICKQMNINVSGDTVIKILLRNAQSIDPKCGEFIGVDDWAYKKGHTYGTIICDGVSHKPIALLDGRDGSALKEWLKNNQHIKIITRDRASSYAKAIAEALPQAMQIADRFHLHQNLLKAIKDALGREVPASIMVSAEDSSSILSDSPTIDEPDSKKNELTDDEKQRREAVIQIQSYLSQGYSSKVICEMMHTTYRQIRKFSKGDPDSLCCRNKSSFSRKSELDQYKPTILEQLALKTEIKGIYKLLVERGHTGKLTNLYDYCKRLVEKTGIDHQTNTNILGVKLKKDKPKGHCIERNRILKYLWSNFDISPLDISFILEKYPFLREIQDCISDFRNIYVNKSVMLLEVFVEKYFKSTNKNLKSFANGIVRDFVAVKNSIISDYSNGFLEGNNNRLKMIKRTMYGRAGLDLLRAKIIC